MIEEAIYTLLATTATITSQLGTRPAGDTGVYPVTIPEDPTLPAVSYQIVSSVDARTLLDPIGLTKTRVHMYGAAVQLRDVIKTAIAGYRGTFNGTKIQNILRATTGDVFADVPRQYTAKVDFYIWHS